MEEKKCCCCHSEEMIEEQKSCCSHDEHKEEKSCCEHKNNDTCCENTAKEDSCCCHTHEEKHESTCHCHSHEKDDEEESCSCCGVAKKTTQSTCSCCGTTKKSNDEFKVWAIIAISAVFTVLSYINLWGDTVGVLRLLDPGIIAVVLCGLPIYKGAIINLVKRKKITSALLISVALTASLVMGILYGLGVLVASSHGHTENYFFVAAEISVIMAIGEAIEDITTKKSNSAIEALMKIAPDTALVLKNGDYVELKVSEIVIGDIVMIKPNTNISVDGEVIGGLSSVNQANLTGESLPVEVGVGSIVRAGTVNMDGALTVKVTALAKDSLVSKLADYVKNAEKNKSHTVQVANRWAGYIVPGAIICSALVFLVCWLGMNLAPLESMERAITILVVFCPCALGLSVPTAVAASIGCGSRNGALIKNGKAMEELADIRVIAFDKTGTLTEGKVIVTKIVAIDFCEKCLTKLCAGAESSSEHVLAKAVCEYAKQKGIEYDKLDNVKSLVGLGVSAQTDKGLLSIVSGKYAKENYNFDTEKYQSGTETNSFVVLNDKIIGVIYFGDKLREDAKETISELRNLSIKTCMLTGDSESVAKEVGAITGVDEVYASLLPEDKAKIIDAKKSNGVKVAMIGDGVNDSMALSTADCSVAMGIMGNDIAIRSADVALMSDDMAKIPFLVRLARKMKNKMHFNIAISMTINVVSVVLSALGVLDAALGAVVHNCSSVLVCTNSALLLGYKGKKKISKK